MHKSHVEDCSHVHHGALVKTSAFLPNFWSKEKYKNGWGAFSTWNKPLNHRQGLWILLDAPGISEPLLSWFNFINIYLRSVRMMCQLQAMDCLKWNRPRGDRTRIGGVPSWRPWGQEVALVWGCSWRDVIQGGDIHLLWAQMPKPKSDTDMKSDTLRT